MDEFERHIHRAMARKEAPAWFEAKVLAAVHQPRRRSQPAWFRWAAALAATVVLTGGITLQYQHSKERAAGEAARAKLVLALEITSKKLQHIERQIEAVQEGN